MSADEDSASGPLISEPEKRMVRSLIHIETNVVGKIIKLWFYF